MGCIFDERWIGEHGIGRFASELAKRLPHKQLVAGGRPMSPIDPFRLLFSSFNKGDWFLSPGYNAPLLSSVPYVLTVHDLNHVDRPENSSFLKRIYYRTVLRRLCKKARAVLTDSEYSRSRICEFFGLPSGKVFNVGCGVSPGFSPEGQRYVRPNGYFLCVSNRKGHKNEDGLLRAFAMAKLPGNPDLVLTGVASEALRALAGEMGVGGRLVFTGRLSEGELASLYRGAIALVFPSFYEGFGLPIVEAFACGTPVITSSATSMREIAGDAAMLVDPSDVESMARGMNEVASSEALRAKMAEAGLERATIYTWDAVAERVKAAVLAVESPGYSLGWGAA